MTRRIPATIITGFLGAGKTSLVRHLVATSGRRLALIINEFGDLGVDREILTGCGDSACREEDIVELANGCLCCTVADDFLPTLTTLLTRPEPPEHILIETSGLALPKPLVKAFGWPEVRTRVTVDGVIAVIDGAAAAVGRFDDTPPPPGVPAAEHESPLAELFEDQLQCADLVILNKADLLEDADGATLARVRETLAPFLRPGVKVVTARHGRIAPEIMLGLAAAAEDDLATRPSHHDAEDEHDHEDFESFVAPLPAITDPEALVVRLQALAATHDILRMKGFLHVPGKPLRLVLQAVGARIERAFDRPWRPGEERVSRLVVIGQRGLDRAGILAALAEPA